MYTLQNHSASGIMHLTVTLSYHVLYTAVSKQSDCSMKSRMTTKQRYTNANATIAGLLELLMCLNSHANGVFVCLMCYLPKEKVSISRDTIWPRFALCLSAPCKRNLFILFTYVLSYFNWNGNEYFNVLICIKVRVRTLEFKNPLKFL